MINISEHPENYLDFSAMNAREGVDIGGCKVYTGSQGRPEMPAMVFIHGGYHGAWCFSHYLDYFSEHGIGCHAVDLPGHGALASDITLDIDVTYLAESLQTCVIAMERPVVVVGHSAGALPAMLTAMNTHTVSGLILLAPSPPGNLPSAQALPTLPMDRLVDAPLATEVRRRFLGTDERVCVDSVTALMCPESPSVLNDRYALRIHIDPVRITCPGICIEAGLDDAARHPEGQDQAVANFLGIDYICLKHHPHCMMYGPRWRESAEFLLKWYRRCFPA